MQGSPPPALSYLGAVRIKPIPAARHTDAISIDISPFLANIGPDFVLTSSLHALRALCFVISLPEQPQGTYSRDSVNPLLLAFLGRPYDTSFR